MHSFAVSAQAKGAVSRSEPPAGAHSDPASVRLHRPCLGAAARPFTVDRMKPTGSSVEELILGWLSSTC
jgi:hypothetical protein